jgi:DNA-binding PadR family transcriptional regulator
MSMQEPTFLVLTALAAAESHGYGVMRAVEELSGGRVTLRPGTLYAALDRLATEGLVEVAREERTEGGQKRRFYRLTPAGGTTLRAEAEERQRVSAVAIQRLTRPAPIAPAGPA